MNKTAIKNFAIWARNKLIADIRYKAGLLGITEKGIKSPLSQSTQTVQFFDIGTKEPSSVTGSVIEQRKKLVEEIQRKSKESDHATAFKNVIEEVAYTWFNRLIAIRFMEVNDYLPTRIRVLSSEGIGKAEPDLVTHAIEANLDYSAYEKDRIIQLKHENKLDELFRMLFIKQCNALNTNLPELFEKTSDYTELLLNVSFTDKEGVVYHLISDISEDDFNVSKEGQVEIIGWLYQYYNTEPKDETFALLKKNVKITKERIPAATQLFTPDWIVRYMVENSLGRLWLEGHPNDNLKSNWKYYLDEAEQEYDVQKQIEKIRGEYKTLKPEDIKVIDPAMGSGHILVYAFDVLMQIYESHGYSQRDAAKRIVENNLFGLDIDNRAYQLAYFAIMMKARQYNRGILNRETKSHVYAIQESNDINRNQLKYFGAGLSEMEKNTARLQLQGLLDTFFDAKEYGSILNVKNFNWQLLREFIKAFDADGQMALDTIGIEHTSNQMYMLVEIGEVMAQKYEVAITNPPYMGFKGMNQKLSDYLQINYLTSKYDMYCVFMERIALFTKKIGISSLITQNSWMFLSRYEGIRDKLLANSFLSLVHLGTKAFDEIGGEVVQTVAYCFCKSHPTNLVGTFVKLTNIDGEDAKRESFFNDNLYFYSPTDKFKRLPSNIFAYWVSDEVLQSFEENPIIEDSIFFRQGMATSDNNRFLRQWTEVNLNKVGFSISDREEAKDSGYKWFPYNKGGSFRKWYGNNDLVVNWENDGAEMRSFTSTLPQGTDVRLKSKEYYFKKGFTWSALTSGAVSVRYCPEGFIFDTKGSMGFPYNQDHIKYFTALINSKPADLFLSILAPTLDFNLVSMKQIPMVIKNLDLVNEIAENCINISISDWDSTETSWDFNRNPLICGEQTVAAAFEKWEHETTDRFTKLKANEEELNRIFIEAYGLQTELTPEVKDEDVTVFRADLERDIRSFISYAVGCIFGRYSLDFGGLVYAGGDWSSNKYISFKPDDDNIIPITDEEYLQDDLVNSIIEFVKIVYGPEKLEENLDFIAKALGDKGNSSSEVIRNYFLKNFFKDHCQIYQKRPIYWLFDSGKQHGFKALVYMHRYDENTTGNLRIDYLHRIQRIYENEIARMQDAIENSKDAREVTAATKRKEKLIKQLQETKEYDEKIAHLALARISIDLDDGVKVNYEKVQTDRDGKKLDVLAKI